MPQISVYIIAFNEAEKIEQALKSVAWADEIVVADSFSTDGTADIAKAHGARVVQIPFTGFGALRNEAIAACSHDWVFSLDSDERCTQRAKDEILNIINLSDRTNADNEVTDIKDAYYVPRRNYFMGKWIRHAGFYPDYRQPQLFRKGALIFNQDVVHESYTVNSNKPCGYLKAAINQVPFKSLEELLKKANKYSTLGADKLMATDKPAGMLKALSHGFWAAFSMYVLKRGFLDGWPGLVMALANFEGTFYKYAKFYLKKQGLASFLQTDLPD